MSLETKLRGIIKTKTVKLVKTGKNANSTGAYLLNFHQKYSFDWIEGSTGGFVYLHLAVLNILQQKQLSSKNEQVHQDIWLEVSIWACENDLKRLRHEWVTWACPGWIARRLPARCLERQWPVTICHHQRKFRRETPSHGWFCSH